MRRTGGEHLIGGRERSRPPSNGQFGILSALRRQSESVPAVQKSMETISSSGITVPSSMTRTLSVMEMCRTTPVTVTYAPPDFRSSGTKYSMVTSGRSFSRAERSVRHRFSSSADCASSSRLSAVSRAVSPYRRLAARQRGKRREQRGTVEHHIRSYRVLRIVLKRVNEVSVVQKN